MPRTTTVHEAAEGYHDGEYAACLECQHIAFHYALRTVTGRLLWDGEDEEHALGLLGKDPEYRLYREVWQQQSGQPVLLKVERIGRVGRFDSEAGRVVAVTEVIED